MHRVCPEGGESQSFSGAHLSDGGATPDELYEMYLRSEYEPLREEEAVETVKEMLKIFARAGIDVIRVGLKSTDNIDIGSDALGAGTYHPAFRQLAEGALAREELERQLGQMLKTVSDPGSASEAGSGTKKCRRMKVTFYSSPESFSDMVGLKGANKIYFSEKISAAESALCRGPQSEAGSVPLCLVRTEVRFTKKSAHT